MYGGLSDVLKPRVIRCKTAAARVRRTAINVVDVSDNVSEHTYPDKTVM